MDARTMLETMSKTAAAPGLSHVMVSPSQYAGLKAAVDWQGRDRRRIKREVRKAMDKARRQSRNEPHVQYRVDFDFWRA